MIQFSASVLGHPITLTAVPLGGDWHITIIGGCAPHVGSVSLAEYENGTVTLRTLERAGHKDQLISDLFARTVAERCQCAVCGTCGIHYDNPGKAGLEEITLCARGLLEELCRRLPEAGAALEEHT